MRVAALAYSVLAYVVFLGAFLYAIGFVGNVLVPKSIDSGPAVPTSTALLVDAALLGAFAVQHSVMARRGFKAWWTRVVPAPVERSTFVLASSLVLILLFREWRPLPEPVWSLDPRAGGVEALGAWLLTALSCLGWATVLVSTFLIDHFDLFGLRQGWAFFRGRTLEPRAFTTVGLYRRVRHPIMLGFIVAFWATPVMTWGHLLFAALTTGYVLVAIQLEERDLVAHLGQAYDDYRKRVPMLSPRLGGDAPEREAR